MGRNIVVPASGAGRATVFIHALSIELSLTSLQPGATGHGLCIQYFAVQINSVSQ